MFIYFGPFAHLAMIARSLSLHCHTLLGMPWMRYHRCRPRGSMRCIHLLTIPALDVLHVPLLHLMEKLPLKWSSNRLGWLSSNYPLTNQDQPSLCRSYHPPQPTAAHLVGMEEAGLDDRPPHPPIFDLGVAEISAAVLMKKKRCVFSLHMCLLVHIYTVITHI